MESVVSRSAARGSPLIRRIDTTALSAWAVVVGVVLYMAIDGGGYDLVVRSQVGVAVWWIVLLAAVLGLIPAARLTRAGSVGLALFAGFVAWTALATTWSLSSERSLQELSRVAFYLGILVLGICIHRDRDRALRHTVNALATAVFVVAALALASRLRPDLFVGAQQTASFLPDAQGRLGWPLNYWNALAALIAFGLPLLLAVTASARSLAGQAAAAGAIPVVALCGYLTFSRGGLIAGVAGLLVFFTLAPERLPKLASALVAAAGSAVLIAGASHRSAIESGLSNPVAKHEGATLLVAVILVTLGVALLQLGISLAVRHGTPPRWLTIPPQRARALLLCGAAACVVIALLAGAPARISHAWRDFKHPSAAALHRNSISRFTAVSGNGRYDYWKTAVDATGGHVLGGSGPGTFQLLWLPRAPYFSYVENAHSLYFETLAELGIVGLGLLIAFFALVIGAAMRLVKRSRYEARVLAASAGAALVAFSVSAGLDWVWQVPALPAAFLLLAAAILAPGLNPAREDAATGREHGQGSANRSSGRLGARGLRVGAGIAAVACLLAIGLPLATTSAERQSQAAVSSKDPALALNAARAAVRLEPGGAAAQLQLALVLETQGDTRDALAAARTATIDEPSTWTAWLVRSRLEAEAGQPAASLASFRRARSLNPRSPLFRT